jgi:hypothetical protein
MKPMTPDQRREVRFFVPPGQNPAAPELVAHVATGARALEISTTDPAVMRLARDMIAVVQRLLDAEQQLATCRRVLADAVTVADDTPDYGLSAGDLLTLLTGSGLNLADDIADAEATRDAHTLAGA